MDDDALENIFIELLECDAKQMTMRAVCRDWRRVSDTYVCKWLFRFGFEEQTTVAFKWTLFSILKSPCTIIHEPISIAQSLYAHLIKCIRKNKKSSRLLLTAALYTIAKSKLKQDERLHLFGRWRKQMRHQLQEIGQQHKLCSIIEWSLLKS
jgi:hypothetical protein